MLTSTMQPCRSTCNRVCQCRWKAKQSPYIQATHRPASGNTSLSTPQWPQWQNTLGMRQSRWHCFFSEASDLRPNGVRPPVPVVSPSLHSLCLSKGDTYDVSQMLVTLRLCHHQTLTQWRRVLLRGGADLQLIAQIFHFRFLLNGLWVMKRCYLQDPSFTATRYWDVQ